MPPPDEQTGSNEDTLSVTFSNGIVVTVDTDGDFAFENVEDSLLTMKDLMFLLRVAHLIKR